MPAYSLSHLSDRELLRGLVSLLAHERATTAAVLAHIAEVDARRLYLPAAHPSMYAYCVQELGLSEDAAYKRIQAARVARQFPVIFEALAEGRLHLTAVGLLAPHLIPENADELLAAAAGKTKIEIEELLAQRFPRSETMALVQALPASPPQLAPAQVEAPGRGPAEAPTGQLAPAQVGPRPKLEPVAPERFLLQLTIGRNTQDKLRHAQELLSHQIPSGDVAEILDRALDALIERLERRKCARASRPLPGGRPSTNPRHIPAHVKRAVWERDQGQCTFVSEAGRRCPARTLLEFDHVDEVARGGRASVAGIRLRCRAHNQFGAERTFGAGFMRHKREMARRAVHARRQEAAARAAQASARSADEARRKSAEAHARAAARDVVPWLRALGLRADEARRAAALCATIPEAPLEQRVRRALSYFHLRSHTIAPGMRFEGAP